jgi:hypothetical protein
MAQKLSLFLFDNFWRISTSFFSKNFMKKFSIYIGIYKIYYIVYFFMPLTRYNIINTSQNFSALYGSIFHITHRFFIKFMCVE